jgi:putative flippase GtrA
MYPDSIVKKYFLNKKYTFQSLNWKPTVH